MRKNIYFGQHGASLLEILVALLVMSLGLLGMAGLQAATSKYRVNVQANGAVSQLVSDLSERIRINPAAAGPSFDPSMGGVHSGYTLESTWAAQLEEIISIDKNCETDVCNAYERAAFDMKVWRQRVRNALPQGNAIVEGNRKDGINLTLMWMDKELTADTVDADTGEAQRSIKAAPLCTANADQTIVHNCCPEVAVAPVGVRCLRVSFLP